jgi:hypothetical protein
MNGFINERYTSTNEAMTSCIKSEPVLREQLEKAINILGSAYESSLQISAKLFTPNSTGCDCAPLGEPCSNELEFLITQVFRLANKLENQLDSINNRI